MMITRAARDDGISSSSGGGWLVLGYFPESGNWFWQVSELTSIVWHYISTVLDMHETAHPPSMCTSLKGL